MVKVSVSGSNVSMAHSAVSSASRAACAMVASRSSRSMVDDIARLALSSASSRRFCSASRRNMRALCTATAAGTAMSSSRRRSSSVNRRGARFSTTVRAPTTSSWKTSGSEKTLRSPQRCMLARSLSVMAGSSAWYSRTVRSASICW